MCIIFRNHSEDENVVVKKKSCVVGYIS